MPSFTDIIVDGTLLFTSPPSTIKSTLSPILSFISDAFLYSFSLDKLHDVCASGKSILLSISDNTLSFGILIPIVSAPPKI